MKFKPEDFEEVINENYRNAYDTDEFQIADTANKKLQEWLDKAPTISGTKRLTINDIYWTDDTLWATHEAKLVCIKSLEQSSECNDDEKT